MARLHLAIQYATRAVPDYTAAEHELAELKTWASAKREENPAILVLTVVAQAFVARLKGDTEEETRIIDLDLREFTADEIQDALDSGPQSLRDSITAAIVRDGLQE